MLINNNKTKSNDSLHLFLGSKPISHVNDMKYFGLIIDDKLQWCEHIAHVMQKVNINNYRLRKFNKEIPTDLKLKIHNAVSVPVIDYASTVWGNFSKSNTYMINKLEHMAARAISGNFDYIHTRGKDLMQQLNMPTFSYRQKYSTAVLMYKTIHGMAPDHITNNITLLTDITKREPRSYNKLNLYVPRANCQLFKHSLMYNGPKIWNSLQPDIKIACSIPVFKRMYKAHVA